MNKGKIIVIEGSSDGIGKTTQTELLKKRLEKEKLKFITHHFPTYGTFQALLIEKYLNGELGTIEELSPYLINSLYALDRAITWKLKLKDLYNQGYYIILDRYTTSSLIYQSSSIKDIEEKKAFIEYVTDYEYNKLQIQKPDLTIFLHMPFETSLELKRSREEKLNTKGDIHERNTEYLKNVYESSLFVANYLNWDTIECCESGVLKSPEEIHEDIYKLIKSK